MTIRAADDADVISRRLAELAEGRRRIDIGCTCAPVHDEHGNAGWSLDTKCPVHTPVDAALGFGLRPGVYRLTADDVRSLMLDRIRASMAAAHFRVGR